MTQRIKAHEVLNLNENSPVGEIFFPSWKEIFL